MATSRAALVMAWSSATVTAMPSGRELLLEPSPLVAFAGTLLLSAMLTEKQNGRFEKTGKRRGK